MKTMVRRVAITGLLAFATTATAGNHGWQLSGDLRVAGAWSARSDRDGAHSEDNAIRARVRVAAQRALGTAFDARVRIAGRYASDQDGARLWLRRAAPGRNGAAFGDATFDEAWLRWRPLGGDWSLQIGRFQTAHTLTTLQGKGLGQNDSPSLDIHWTDGVRLERHVGAGHVARLQLQSMPSGGPGSVHRAPLDFSARGSRIALFAGIDSHTAWGPFIQRGVGVHWYPRTLARAAPTYQDYLTLTARATAAWPLGEGGARLLFGTEVGLAPHTPHNTGGHAWQVEVDIEGRERQQSLGVLWGRAQTGWLVSSDFRNNDTLGELRWLWRASPKLSIDARWRWRQDIDIPTGSLRARIERDIYLRMTRRFP